jgi:hypothetical protein
MARVFLSLLAIFVIILSAIVGLGLLIGCILNWIVPSIDLGSGAIMGVLATGLSLHFGVRLLKLSGEDLVVKHHAEEKLDEELLRQYQAQRKSRRKRF